MKMATLKRLYITDVGGKPEIRLDWDNDRHHGVTVGEDLTADDVARALFRAARLIAKEHEDGAV